MKMREPHIVPLSRQAVDMLRELEPLTNPRVIHQARRAQLRLSERPLIRAPDERKRRARWPVGGRPD